MRDLERISRSQFREAEPGRMRHAPREILTRHLHDHAFAAVVLSGGYVEAGDTGRHRLVAGDVLLHQAWEGHLDHFGAGGADVLVLDIPDMDTGWFHGRVRDPDALARLAERDRIGAAQAMLAELQPKPAQPGDWPDDLARALRDDPGMCLGAWALAHDLRLGSLSRGFRQVFGMRPVGYRLVQRTRRAIAAVQGTTQPLSLVALDCGFADQAHMSRAIKRLALTTPAGLRRTAGKPSSLSA
jgi:AraC-like DNA-binding protein